MKNSTPLGICGKWEESGSLMSLGSFQGGAEEAGLGQGLEHVCKERWACWAGESKLGEEGSEAMGGLRDLVSVVGATDWRSVGLRRAGILVSRLERW